MRNFFTWVSIFCLVIIMGFAGPSLSSSDSKENAQKDRYIASEDGVVKDTETGLEWYPGPDSHTSWYEATIWVKKLTVAGGGWRMPTLEELGNLYEKGSGTRNMTPLLITTGSYVWSGKTKGSSSAWLFHFFNGDEFWRPRGSSTGGGRAFAVRAPK